MKPFNLERALAGEPVVTRDGLKVLRVIHVPESARPSTVLIVTEDTVVAWVAENGMYYDTSERSRSDVFMAPKEVTVIGWVNVYLSGLFSEVYKTEKRAVEGRTDGAGNKPSYATTIKIEHTFEE